MRSAAALIANLLLPETAGQILQVAGGRYLAILDDGLRPVAAPELRVIARLLPADAACQIARVADRLGSDYSEVTAEVANAFNRKSAAPKGSAARSDQNGPDRRHIGRADQSPARVATASFPSMPQRARGYDFKSATRACASSPPVTHHLL